jgi:DNA-binding transcriptional regulator YiaG
MNTNTQVHSQNEKEGKAKSLENLTKKRGKCSPAMTGKELRQALKTMGLSQGKFARHIDVSPSTVGRWASNETPVPKLVKLWIDAVLIVKRILP